MPRVKNLEIHFFMRSYIWKCGWRNAENNFLEWGLIIHFLQEPLFSSKLCGVSMSTHKCRQSDQQAIYGCSRNLYLCFSCPLTSSHNRKKDNPRKEAYKLAHGHSREQIGGQWQSILTQELGKELGEEFCVTTSHDTTHKKRQEGLSKDSAVVCLY